MIITFLLTIFNTFVGFLLSFLPSGNLPTVISNAFTYFVGVMNAFTYVFPVVTLFQAFALVVAVDLAILLWHFINWVIRKIPGMQ